MLHKSINHILEQLKENDNISPKLRCTALKYLNEPAQQPGLVDELRQTILKEISLPAILLTLLQKLEESNKNNIPKPIEGLFDPSMSLMTKVFTYMQPAKQKKFAEIIDNMIQIGIITHDKLEFKPDKKKMHKSLFSGVCLILYEEGFMRKKTTDKLRITEKVSFSFMCDVFGAHVCHSEYSRNKNYNRNLVFEKLITLREFKKPNKQKHDLH